MDRPHMRPRLEIVVPADLAEVRRAFEDRVQHPACTCRGRFARNHLHVEVGPERRHFWSPTLDVTLRRTDEGTLLLGRFGPHPDVWTMYVFLYATWAFFAVVALCWAMAQAVLEEPPTALLVVLGAGVLAGLTWLSGRVGAALGHDQMEDLFRMVDGLGEARRDEAGVVPDARG
ncbi:MAG: hypothetical protein H6732_14660 [Alphaproteobacteria bacterium]|nr:hypothetical protein [Alphaproteobacteria bacterium]